MSLDTMTKIGTYTVGAGGISSFSFSGIPQTYTDLIVKVSARVSGSETYATAELRLQFNSDTTAANYKYMQHWGLGTGSVGSNNGSNFFFGNIEGGGMTATVFATSEVCIPNYAGNSFKTTIWSSTEEASAANATIVNGLTKWSNTAPITSITILSNTNSFVQYSTFTLYGVKNYSKSVPTSANTTGGTKTSDGTYVTHTFNSTGTFTTATQIDADILVVAGGGGGAHGGGGAGGLLTFTSQTLAATSSGYVVTVGAGGTAGLFNVQGGLGNDSQFGLLTLVKGGGGGGYVGSAGQTNGSAGGSGGGGAGSSGSLKTGGDATSGQGNAGGSNGSQTGSPYPSGGGGGAGAVGANAASTNLAGAGGIGLASSLSGSTVYYAGGGGGGNYIASGTAGAGGTGGGGAGSVSSTGTAGTANTGGGGGGGAAGGAAGGSGIVIVRYKIKQ